MKLLDRIFRREELGHGPAGPYVRRWTLLRLFDYRLYLHRFLRSDAGRHLHDHPCDVWTLMLRGRYVETTPHMKWKGPLQKFLTPCAMKVYRAPCLRRFRAEHIHRIDLPSENMGKTWTLCLFLPKRREWGFYLDDGSWVRWDKYSSAIAGEQR